MLISRSLYRGGLSRRVLFFAGLMLAPAVLAKPPASPPKPSVEVSPELSDLISAYFTTPQRDERKTLAPLIEKAARGDADRVAKALLDVDLWSAGPEGPVNIFFPAPGRPSVAGVYEVPLGYSSDERFPLLVCIPDAGLAPEVTLTRARLYLKSHISEFVVLGTTSEIVGGFHQTPAHAGKLRGLIKKLSQLVRIDRNRIYVLGIGDGADSAWLAGITHPDLFAGVIAINGYPDLPYPKQSYPILLDNLRHTPVLTVWNHPLPVSSATPTRADIIANRNRMIAQLAKKTSLPIRSIEVPSTDHPDLQPPIGEISDIVARDRIVLPKKISHWFRYPNHSMTAWLRQVKFAGSIWNEPALSIKAGPGVDQAKFVQDILRSKLAFISGTLEGQTVTLEVKHTSGVELALPLGSLNPAAGVKVVCNGRIRHEGKLPPDIPTMLKSAYDRWDFQNPVAVRLSLSVDSD